jgi:hypothetical protein
MEAKPADRATENGTWDESKVMDCVEEPVRIGEMGICQDPIRSLEAHR